jgi:predicted O-methyltransferase YrrM
MNEIEKIIYTSNSNLIVQYISNNMMGKTFHHHYHVLYDIRSLLGPSKKIYTEIGSYCGGSACLMLQHNYETEIHCIDPLHAISNQKDILSSNINKFNKHNYKINIYEKFSYDNEFIKQLEDSNFKTDILFIDGGHSYNDVMNDFYKFEKFVNPGGYIIFDDYLDNRHCPDVKHAVDNIILHLNSLKFENVGLVKNFQDSFTNMNCEMEYLNEYVVKKRDIPTQTNEIKFAIVMATYCRKNGQTPAYLKKSLESIFSQKCKNWDFIIVADKYEPKEELQAIIEEFENLLVTNKMDNKIIFIYNEKVERDYIKNPKNLWCVAGASSMNCGITYAKTNGYKYYVHLDDDDYWADNHLEELTQAYANYPSCIFAYTQSMYGTGVLPNSNSNIYIYPNNRAIQGGQLIHSAFSFRVDIVPFLYVTHFEETDIVFCPADYKMITNIRQFLDSNNNYSSIYIPKLTCYHIEEGINK